MSGPIIEAIEPDEFLGQALLLRLRNIPTYALYGPPDMCYIVKEQKSGLMGKTLTQQGYYHHVFGVDTSSTATPAAYIKSVMTLAG